MDLNQLKIVIRGAGEMASACAWRLHMSHLRVVMTEREHPIAVRRRVSFCEAVLDGTAIVEGVVARRIDDPDLVRSLHAAGEIPLLIDPELKSLSTIKPDVLVEATLSKRNIGVHRDLAPLVIALGPGFSAGSDVDLVIETNRGHNLGRVITRGPAEPNTGVPGVIAAETVKRVLRAPTDGEFVAELDLGTIVSDGQTVATVSGVPIKAELSGLLRGLIRPGTYVHRGLKVGDVDPRGALSYLDTISDKARAVAGGVLEGILRVYNC